MAALPPNKTAFKMRWQTKQVIVIIITPSVLPPLLHSHLSKVYWKGYL